MVQKIQKTTFKALISLTILAMLFSAFALVMVDNAAADEPTEFREGEVPSVEAEQVEEIVPVFQEGEDEPAPLPNHPPIDEIPPIPMPQDTDELPESEGPGSGILHNAVTRETIVSPVDETPLLGGFQQGGGYSGADGGGSIEELPTTFYNMYKISNTGDFPWRMNVKLIMRFGPDYYVASGTMRDAETVLTAGHCVYDYGGYGWADEIWVYPGWDGNDNSCNAETYGWGYSTYFGTWTGWTNYGDYNYDVGIIGVTRGVGMLTGWYGWSYGGDCEWHLGKTYNNASYPAECCNPPGCTLHNGSDMYYWYGHFDSCPSWNRLQINTSGGCYNAGWGGMSGSGAYYIDGDGRYVHAMCSTSDRATFTRYARQWDDWVSWNNNTFIPNVRGSSFDLQALDVNAQPATIEQGGKTTLLNHFATNPTNGSASGTWTFGVYLSTNSDISTADTLLSTQFYDWNFGTMSSVRVNMVQVTIPLSTPPGDYWIGVVYDAATDGNSGNNDSDCWDAVPIHVEPAPPYIELTPTGYTFPDVQVGQCSGTHSFTLQNIGGGTATGTVSLTGAHADQFEITSGSGSFSLGAGATKTISVRFCPTSIGLKSASLFADGSNCNDDSSSLSGTGIELLEPDIDVTHTHLEFERSEAECNPSTSAETALISDEIEVIIIDGPPTPPVDVSDTIVNASDLSASAVMLNDVPTSQWTYGCTATSAGMLFGYYDRTGYPNMYAGKTNGGVCPLTDLGQGYPDNPDYPIKGSCYIIATENGLDGISSTAHADDYWISYGSPGPDPWYKNWPEHTWELCTADFLGTNQWKWDYNLDGNIDCNTDGSTMVWNYADGSKLYDYCPSPVYGTPATACCHGMRLFAESRGYTVETNYNQLTNNQHSDGFTLAEFQAEIDRGRPVLVHLEGHSMVGRGYEAKTDEIYIHDTWDNDVHKMTWGGSYAGMDMYAVTVIHLVSPEADCQTIVVSNVGDADLIVSDIEIGYQKGEPTGWLGAKPNSFTVLPEGSQGVNVCVDCTGLSSGEYHGWLDIRSNDPDEDPWRVTVTLTVTTVNRPPVANDDAYNTNKNTTLNVPAPGVLANDSDPDGDPLSAIKVTDPSHGTLTLYSDGSFTYVPDTDFSGSDSFTYKANDGLLDSNTATVTITVMDIENEVYLDPQDSSAPFCSTTDVEVWVDATDFQSGQIKLLYDSTCGDVTNWEPNSTLFPLGTWESDTPGEEWITFMAISPLSGNYLIGTLTIHCVCETNDCSTPLDFVDPSKLFDPSGSEIPANWVDGTFACTTGMCGDVAPYPDCNGIVDMGDVVLLLNYVGHPGEYQLCCEWCGDVAPCPASDGVINMGDVVLLLNYVGHPGEYDLCCE